MIDTNGSPATVRAPADQDDPFGRYVRRSFRHTLRGYSPEEVDAHLRQVRGWFALAGFDRLLAARREDLLGGALREADATVEHARRQAATLLEDARRDAAAIVAEAQRRAAAAAADAERHRETLRTLARTILDETGATG